MISLATLYHSSIPSFVTPYLGSPSLKRLRNVDMNCGMSFTSFPRFSCIQEYSRYHHSLGTAMIVWHFTRDRKQTLAALFHDISTPAFSHVADFVRGDHMKQESTENETSVFIMSDPVIMAQLQKDGISAKDVSDYHLYPVADNDSPRLSADRLEYTCGNIISYQFGTEADIRRLYGDLHIALNEEGVQELAFTHDECAVEFAHLALKCGRIYSCEEDRYGMERLAVLIREAMALSILDETDLYLGDNEVFRRLENSPLRAKAREYRKLSRVIHTDHTDPEALVIHTKKRYIDPLGPGGRASALSEEFRKARDAFLAEDQDCALKGEYDE